MDYSKSVGNVTELQCLSKFIEMGFDCSIPYGDASKYDFVADVNGEFLRIQCKSCSNPLRGDGTRDTQAIIISCCSQTTNTKKTVRHNYTSNDIDYFATFYEGNVYLIPVEECSTSKTLRFSPPNNGQISTYNMAKNYLIENVFSHCQNENFLIQKKNKAVTNVVDKNMFICSQCNISVVNKEGGICNKCASFNQRRAVRPSREELKSLIRAESFLEIGRQFQVTDNAIRKWCRAENLPSKKTDIKKYSDEEWSHI